MAQQGKCDIALIGLAVMGENLALNIASRGYSIAVYNRTASVTDADGKVVPGLAPAAKQQGDYVAGVIAARLRGKPAPPPFRYRHQGSLATIGRQRAVADFGWLKLSGFVAWALWSTAYLFFLVGFRNRMVVGANWLWNYLTFDRGARLITGVDAAPAGPHVQA
jgi:hypothetical protein